MDRSIIKRANLGAEFFEFVRSAGDVERNPWPGPDQRRVEQGLAQIRTIAGQFALRDDLDRLLKGQFTDEELNVLWNRSNQDINFQGGQPARKLFEEAQRLLSLRLAHIAKPRPATDRSRRR